MLLFLKNLLFSILVPGGLAIFLPYWIVRHVGTPLRVEVLPLLLAAPLILLGTATYVWAVCEFGLRGRGTPAPIDPPRQLVVAGPYRYVRNPLSLAVLSVIAGWAVLFGSGAVLRYGLTVAIAYHFIVIRIEEPLLRRRFGDAYEAYCNAVRRWVPGGGIQ